MVRAHEPPAAELKRQFQNHPATLKPPKRKPPSALQVLKREGDAVVAASVLSALSSQREAFSLDNITELIAVCEMMLHSAVTDSMTTALDVLDLVLTAYSSVIRDTCRLATSHIGVDISYEQRRQKCQVALMAFNGLLPKLGFAVRREPALGASAALVEQKINALSPQ